jgi:putative ABC transport system permease protein
MMLRHLLKLVWNRRRASALLVLEIFFSFLATLVVATLGLYFWDNYRRPLGFDWHDVWSIDVASMHRHFDHGPDAAVYARLATLLRELKALPPVVAAAAAARAPYSSGEDRGTFSFEHGPVTFEFLGVTREFDQAMRLRPVAGRWFARGDESLGWQPVVINQALAHAVYGNEDPVGRRFGLPDRSGEQPEQRVVGVVREYRDGGELAASKPFLFALHEPESRHAQPFATLAIRVRPGTSAAFEEAVARRLRAVAPDWSFTIAPLADMRDSSFRLRLALLAAGGLIAAFLLAMIGLGIVGVVWQNLLQRTREIGLRRAAGAARAAVQRQIVLEQLLLTAIGVAAALLLVAQVPILGVADFLSGEVLAAGAALAMAAIFLLVGICAFHPSVLASRVQPAEALRYE